MMERRWSERKPVHLGVALFYSGLGLVRCSIRDISLDGVFLDTGLVALPRHAPIELVIELPERDQIRQYNVPALVLRSNRHGAGAMFRQLDRDAFYALQCLVRHTDGGVAAVAPTGAVG